MRVKGHREPTIHYSQYSDQSSTGYSDIPNKGAEVFPARHHIGNNDLRSNIHSPAGATRAKHLRQQS
eukprot:3729076-Pyramimonas_sp.AAC.1